MKAYYKATQVEILSHMSLDDLQSNINKKLATMALEFNQRNFDVKDIKLLEKHNGTCYKAMIIYNIDMAYDVLI